MCPGYSQVSSVFHSDVTFMFIFLYQFDPQSGIKSRQDHFANCAKLRPLFKSAYQQFFSYFSTKIYILGTQKNRLNETGDGSFQHPRHILKLKGKKIFTISRSTIWIPKHVRNLIRILNI